MPVETETTQHRASQCSSSGCLVRRAMCGATVNAQKIPRNFYRRRLHGDVVTSGDQCTGCPLRYETNRVCTFFSP